jgi:hypothetical protein
MHPIQKVAIVLGLCGLTNLTTHAQKLPVPGQKNPDWKLQKTEELASSEPLVSQPRPVPMPSPEITGGMLDSTGAWQILYDPKHHVRYNLRAQKQGIVRVQNLETGTVYTYQRVPTGSAKPKPN